MILITIGINYSSPTLTAALANLTPLFTFLFAIIFRLETMDLRSSSTRAKSLGTIVLVSGALVMTLYKGPALVFPASSSNSHQRHLLSQQLDWILGGIFLLIAYLIAAALNILQVAIVKEFPDMVAIIFFTALFATFQCGILSIFVERNTNAWAYLPDIALIGIVYSAICGMGLKMNVTIWCLHKKGPLFVAMFEPLGMLIAAIMGVIFLGDVVRVGSITGGVIIAVGFYSILWGLAQENKVRQNAHGYVSSAENNNAPLLENYTSQDA